MIAKIVVLPSGQEVTLKFTCGNCINGHRAGSCYHYSSFLANKQRLEYEDMFYLIKGRGKKIDRTTAFLQLQVDPTQGPLQIDRNRTPRCPRSQTLYRFECSKSCCKRRQELHVAGFVRLRVCHTELNMDSLPDVDPIPFCGSEDSRKAYRTWQCGYSDVSYRLHLESIFAKDSSPKHGHSVAEMVKRDFGFDAAARTQGMEKKTITSFQRSRSQRLNPVPIGRKSIKCTRRGMDNVDVKPTNEVNNSSIKVSSGTWDTDDEEVDLDHLLYDDNLTDHEGRRTLDEKSTTGRVKRDITKYYAKTDAINFNKNICSNYTYGQTYTPVLQEMVYDDLEFNSDSDQEHVDYEYRLLQDKFILVVDPELVALDKKQRANQPAIVSDAPLSRIHDDRQFGLCLISR